MPGDLYRVINAVGLEVGLAIFIELVEPHMLSEADGVHKSAYWNMKVLMDGRIKYLDTSNWTLIPAP